MKKRIMAAVLIIALILTSGIVEFSNLEAVYAAGENRQEIPEGYTPIYDIADLYAIRNDLEGEYILMNDIDMSVDTSEGGDYDCGTGWDPIEGFHGTLDGNGYRIVGMHIFGNYSSPVGLFGSTSGDDVTIKNLGMVDCDINININQNYSGYWIRVGTIMGSIWCPSSKPYGGIFLDNCYSSGKIVVHSDAEDISCDIGGIIGSVSGTDYGKSRIQNCYNICDITISVKGEDKGICGGICGDFNVYNDSLLSQCYNFGHITGSESLESGAICGYMLGDWLYKNCNYLRGTANQGMGNFSDTSNCVALSEAQMKNAKLFTGFDFTEIWEIDPYCSYPYPQLKNNRMIRVNSIRLNKNPNKLTYAQGDTLDLNGAALEITYEDGIKTTAPVTLDMLSGYNMTQIGKQSVSINYGGATTAFDIEVKEVPVSSIKILDSLSVYRGNSYQFQAEILPANASNKSVKWESSNPAVVSIDNNGIMRASAGGTAVITARSANNLYSSCTVTVLVPAVSLQLSQNYLALKEGESQTLAVQIFPLESTDAVKWSSSNTGVAEVYDGLVVARNAGEARIIVQAGSGVIAECTVLVEKLTSAQKPGNNSQNSGNTDVSQGSNSAAIKKVSSTKAKIKNVKNIKSNGMKLTLSGLSGNDGYQIQYGLKKNFKGAKAVTKKTSSLTVKKLQKNKTYYVRARVYKKIAGKTYYGKWSSRKSVKIKK